MPQIRRITRSLSGLGTGANNCSTPLGSASNHIIDKDWGRNQRPSEAGTEITRDYLSLPYYEVGSPPVTFGSPTCELVVRDAHSSELDTESSPKVIEDGSSPSGSTPNPIVIYVETDKCDSDADTEIMTSPEF